MIALRQTQRSGAQTDDFSALRGVYQQNIARVNSFMGVPKFVPNYGGIMVLLCPY